MAPYKVVKQGYLQLAPLGGKKLQQQRKVGLPVLIVCGGGAFS